MKCLYAISTEATLEAQSLCTAYSNALEKLLSTSMDLADVLRAFVESRGVAVLKIEDEDWEYVKDILEGQGESTLAGELFWLKSDVQRAQVALDSANCTMSLARILAVWLSTKLRTNATEASKLTTPDQVLTKWLAIQAQRDRALTLLMC